MRYSLRDMASTNPKRRLNISPIAYFTEKRDPVTPPQRKCTKIRFRENQLGHFVRYIEAPEVAMPKMMFLNASTNYIKKHPRFSRDRSILRTQIPPISGMIFLGKKRSKEHVNPGDEDSATPFHTSALQSLKLHAVEL